jgi:hypothetical protein
MLSKIPFIYKLTVAVYLLVFCCSLQQQVIAASFTNCNGYAGVGVCAEPSGEALYLNPYEPKACIAVLKVDGVSKSIIIRDEVSGVPACPGGQQHVNIPCSTIQVNYACNAQGAYDISITPLTWEIGTCSENPLSQKMKMETYFVQSGHASGQAPSQFCGATNVKLNSPCNFNKALCLKPAKQLSYSDSFSVGNCFFRKNIGGGSSLMFLEVDRFDNSEGVCSTSKPRWAFKCSQIRMDSWCAGGSVKYQIRPEIVQFTSCSSKPVSAPDVGYAFTGIIYTENISC